MMGRLIFKKEGVWEGKEAVFSIFADVFDHGENWSIGHRSEGQRLQETNVDEIFCNTSDEVDSTEVVLSHGWLLSINGKLSRSNVFVESVRPQGELQEN